MFLFNRSNKKTPFQGSLHSAARRRRGFTLIELLVVLVILVLTASIVGPRVLDQL
ncbi:MAG: prepilin-type N-terminal cleavage/methylation domain-containing protein, partial [Burkholderiaceae bacterium]|nr:prepilin-type N-terminal cleavage/methylation domain-containing protein [Burkholderiaceae bacterium]